MLEILLWGLAVILHLLVGILVACILYSEVQFDDFVDYMIALVIIGTSTLFLPSLLLLVITVFIALIVIVIVIAFVVILVIFILGWVLSILDTIFGRY